MHIKANPNHFLYSAIILFSVSTVSCKHGRVCPLNVSIKVMKISKKLSMHQIEVTQIFILLFITNQSEKRQSIKMMTINNNKLTFHLFVIMMKVFYAKKQHINYIALN